jgi:chemotaxis protein CheD
MKSLVVGVSDARLSGECDVSIVTYALGSCVGVAIYDPLVRVGGLLHYMLPDSRMDPAKAEQYPWMFADTAIPMFFQQAYRLGAEKSRLRVVVAGGAQVLQAEGSLDIGRKNEGAMRRILGRAGVLLDAEDMGGGDIRTLRLEIGTGRLMVRRNGMEELELSRHQDWSKMRGRSYGR